MNPDPKSESVLAPRMHRTRHALDEGTRKSMVTLLNQRLVDTLDLYSQTKHAHWNVKGMGFHTLHLLFDEIAERVEHQADLLAERATALGGSAMGTLRMAAKATSLEEFPKETENQKVVLEALVDRFSRHAGKVAEGISRAEENGDPGTADVLTQITRELDQDVYLLESHLQTS